VHRASPPHARARPPHVPLLCAVGLTFSIAARADWPVPTPVGERGANETSALLSRHGEALAEQAARNPRAAEPSIVRALEDSDPQVRRHAAELTARLRIRAARPALLRWLEQGPVEDRVAAAQTLGAVGGREDIAILARLSSDRDPATRLAATRAIGAVGGESAVVPLLDRLSDDSAEVRVAAAQALASLNDRRAVLSLLGLVQDPVSEVREAVCVTLGRLRDARALRGLVSLLRDSQQEVRLAAARSLGALGTPDALVDLAPVALGTQGGPDAAQQAELGRAAVHSLGLIGGASARALLVRVFRTHPSQEVARAAASALRAMGEAAYEVIPALAADPIAPNLREPLIALLGDLGGDDAADVLLGMPESSRANPDAYLRALGRTGSTAALRALLRAATERDGDAARQTSIASLSLSASTRRASVLRALDAWVLRTGRLEPGALDPLAILLRDLRQGAVPTMRTSAAPNPSSDTAVVVRLMGYTFNPRAAVLLAPLLSATAPGVRLAAAQALVRVGVEGVEADVARALCDPDPAVRSPAADALARHGTRVALLAIASLWRGDRPIDRRAAVFALGRIARRAGDTSVAATLTARLPDARPLVAAAIVDALGALASLDAPTALDTLDRSIEGQGALSLAAAEALSNAAAQASGPPADRLRERLSSLLAGSRPDPVRAVGAWGLGAFTSPAVITTLSLAATDPSNAVSGNALGALARAVAAGAVAPPALRALACSAATTRPNPLVRANALELLAALGHRCDGAPELSMLFEARSPWVRRAAAHALAATAHNDAVRAVTDDMLLRCANSDRADLVAQRCRELRSRTAPRADREPLDAVVYSETEDAPAIATEYVLIHADGIARFGRTGPSGWIHEHRAPAGPYTVLDPLLFESEP
jgi:HEAT repeat protein